MSIRLFGLTQVPLSSARCNTVRLAHSLDPEFRDTQSVGHSFYWAGTVLYIYCKLYHNDYSDCPILYDLLPEGVGGNIKEEPDEC